MTELNHKYKGEVIELATISAFEPRVLSPQGTKVFGKSYSSDNVRNINIRVGQKPYAVNLTDLFLQNKDDNFKKYAIFEDFNICILFQTVNVLNAGGVHNLVKLGYRTRFTNQSPVTVLEVLPKTEFIEIASGRLSASFDVTGTLGISFQDNNRQTANIPVNSGASMNMEVGADFKCNIRFNVVTPKIIAVGSGDNTSEWIFHKHDKPLIGTHQVAQLLLVRKVIKKLKFDFNVYATVSFFGYPTKYKNDSWYELESEIMKIRSV